MRSSALSAFAGIGTLVALMRQVVPSDARNFTLRDDFAGNDFFDNFRWWSYSDPTDGTVNYVTQSTARKNNLSYVDGTTGAFVMRADTSTVVDPSRSSGRDSVRIHSKKLMGDGVLVAKIGWMPQGCGTWPAFWTSTTTRWPTNGEIDIIEGANDQGPLNLASLHTTDGCDIQRGNSSLMTGTSYATDCSYQPGCSSHFNLANSFGPDYNRNGGGFWAMTRDTAPGGAGISVYFWPANTNTSNLPASVAAAKGAAPAWVDPVDDARKWGTPAAHFPNDNSTCAMSQFFGEHEIIINLTFCGSWAGETFSSVGTCPNTTCSDFVLNNPSAFEDAYWSVDYLRTYTDGAGAQLSTRAAVVGVVTAMLVASLQML